VESSRTCEGTKEGEGSLPLSPGLRYVSDDAEKPVSVTAESTCGDGNEAPVSFHNTPLTNITVSVDSQVNGGTASDVECLAPDGTTVVGSGSTDGDGDATVPAENLLPSEPPDGAAYTCTIVIDP
jgi:hypothetical protein